MYHNKLNSEYQKQILEQSANKFTNTVSSIHTGCPITLDIYLQWHKTKFTLRIHLILNLSEA